MSSQLDRLDAFAQDIIDGKRDGLSPLSTGEGVYVAMAANRMDLRPDYSIAQAIARLGPEWTDELVRRWQYRSTVKSEG